MIKEAIAKIVDKKDISIDEAKLVMDEIMDGKATSSQIAAFIIALRIKGETIDEVIGCVQSMRSKSVKINSIHKILVDTCGTGGDRANTFNISTTAAFVAAGAGVPVAKHGNRAVSSHCGSADLLKSLGVNIEMSPEKVEECLNKIGIGFLFAPILHPAMKYAAEPRRDIGIRTIFNILGPLTNPANAQAQVVGVYAYNLTEIVACVLGSLGSTHVFAVHGTDGLDEITITGDTKISEWKDCKKHEFYVQPEDFGFKPAKLEEIKSDSMEENTKIFLKVLNGEKGPCRDIVLMNAGAAIAAGGASKDIFEGAKLAEKSIDSGDALKKFNEFKDFTQNAK
ncbi:MAG: anthranilate phosphoribosyltransferase [Candidatus Firestonebacteria bacterium]